MVREDLASMNENEKERKTSGQANRTEFNGSSLGLILWHNLCFIRYTVQYFSHNTRSIYSITIRHVHGASLLGYPCSQQYQTSPRPSLSCVSIRGRGHTGQPNNTRAKSKGRSACAVRKLCRSRLN
jgi:hypothetical protein